jgi:hypothetical protein
MKTFCHEYFLDEGLLPRPDQVAEENKVIKKEENAGVGGGGGGEGCA